ncbi:unnamed protein product [Polarella glacialis]|uniref:Uncharacterized protein n=1 Tax=Polarella glacialis TaxID=89957 RepID=A0A813HMY2_POLGL|nr:unnamed protein product [Polarella glacialis]
MKRPASAQAASSRVRKKAPCKKVMIASAMKKSTKAKGQRARSCVFRGTYEKTTGGLTKDKLKTNTLNKVVSKAKSVRAKKANAFGAWNQACSEARKALSIQGFCAVGGKSNEGQALYAKAKSLYRALE